MEYQYGIIDYLMFGYVVVVLIVTIWFTIDSIIKRKTMLGGKNGRKKDD